MRCDLPISLRKLNKSRLCIRKKQFFVLQVIIDLNGHLTLVTIGIQKLKSLYWH